MVIFRLKNFIFISGFFFLDKESDVITALWNLTKRCFRLIKDFEQAVECGAFLSSPLTLLKIIHQLHPLIEGGGIKIILLSWFVQL